MNSKSLLSQTVLFLVIACCAFPAHAMDSADSNFATYKATLQTLCDALVAMQITDKTNANYGALTCPSTNPDNHPIHSRAAEAVYPLAILYKLDTTQAKYRNAAILLGDWLIKIQGADADAAGAWSESWPSTGWEGTTADQLISLAGAYPILKPYLSSTEITSWNNSITSAANWSAGGFFPAANVNYNVTAAVALVMAYSVASSPVASWLTKASSLVANNTLDSINSENLLTGEGGGGVDEGYNIAQSIGYTALYAILTNNAAVKQRAVDMLHAHYRFVYPNGSVDNSWGTRSYKWGYESGTKTAPGVYFTFALLADADPAFNAAGRTCLEYLRTKCIDAGGRVTYGPHAYNHASSTPPCNYQTFARAQSIALALAYGPNVTATAPYPGQVLNWYQYYSTIKVAVVRTAKIMGTVSAYGDISVYSRSTVPKGGSICNLWFEGFGANGYLQSSSATDYTRTETMHMPIESTNPAPLTLTPRLETTIGTTYYTNLYQTGASISASQGTDNVSVTSSGKLVSETGGSSAASFTIVNKFYNTSVTKLITVSGAAASYGIVEPFVKDSGTVFAKTGTNSVTITPATGGTWTVRVDSATTVPYTLSMGTDSARYWCPFPGIEGYPVIVSFTTASTAGQTVSLTISGPPLTSTIPGSAARRPAFGGNLSAGYWGASGAGASIRFIMAESGTARLRIYDVAGRLAATLWDGYASAGEHAVRWAPAAALPRGVYLCVFSAGGREAATAVVYCR